MKLTGQKKQVYDYLKENPGATIRQIRDNTFPGVQKPCMRIAEMEQVGVDIIRLGRNKHREVRYRIGQPITKRVQHVEVIDGVAQETFTEVPI